MTYESRGGVPSAAVAARPDWTQIDTVLLDLDGTLLDLAFDNHFWLEVVPAKFAALQGVPASEARAQLILRFRACEGTLNWYCIDHWSRELGLDIVNLKRAAAGRIAWLPGALEFLRELRLRGKRLVLLTNAHREVLRIKDECTGVTRFMDAVISSHDLGVPKEDARFWDKVRTVECYDPHRTAFIDDSPPVLAAARRSGLAWVYGIRRPDSAGLHREHGSHPAVDSVRDLV